MQSTWHCAWHLSNKVEEFYSFCGCYTGLAKLWPQARSVSLPLSPPAAYIHVLNTLTSTHLKHERVSRELFRDGGSPDIYGCGEGYVTLSWRSLE